jgi:DNA-binding MarR family transcriptional regulator
MQRRQRDAAFGKELFGEPAWDMLLTLFLAHVEGRHVSVSSLCFETAVPATTAHRWMLALIGKGLLVRIGDPDDRRRSHVYLSADAARRTHKLLRDMLRSTG